MMDSANVWALSLTALTTGLLGSLHCLGMCGGASGAIALAAPASRQKGVAPVAMAGAIAVRTITVASSPATFAVEANVLAFNAGRIASYAMAGAAAGAVGGALGGFGSSGVISETGGVRTGLFVFAHLMIVATGLALTGIPQLLAPLERAGGRLWRHIAPLGRGLLPLRSPAHAALFGMLWGWIPCGMVYAMLLTAISAGSPAGGMLTMLAFGAGTLPLMLASGLAAGTLRRWTHHSRVRLIAGMIIVAIGLFGLARTGALAPLQAFGSYCISLMPQAPALRP